MATIPSPHSPTPKQRHEECKRIVQKAINRAFHNSSKMSRLIFDRTSSNKYKRY